MVATFPTAPTPLGTEATVVELYGNNNDGRPRRFTVADGNAIPKGTLMFLDSSARHASMAITSGPTVIPLGILAHDKVANDGNTSVGIWTHGIFSVVASTAITVGQKVKIGGINSVSPMNEPADIGSYALMFGVTYTTAAAAARANIMVNL